MTTPIRLDGNTRLLPIIGDPIVYARSPEFFSEHLARAGANTVCVPLQVPDGALAAVIDALTATPNVDGILVTMPHKQAAFAHCATVTDTAQRLGVVNTMRRNPDGSWHGRTTDGDAFVKAMVDNGATVAGARALLLGAGGAGSAIAAALLEAGVRSLTVHDTDETKAADLLNRLAGLGDGEVVVGSGDPRGHDLVCNATPVGMVDGEAPPVAPGLLDASMFVGDVIAGHGETPLVAAARAAGCGTSDGDAMVTAVQDIMYDFFITPPTS